MLGISFSNPPHHKFSKSLPFLQVCSLECQPYIRLSNAILENVRITNVIDKMAFFPDLTTFLTFSVIIIITSFTNHFVEIIRFIHLIFLVPFTTTSTLFFHFQTLLILGPCGPG